MNICFIYESGFANNNGSNHLLCSVIEGMLKSGHKVHLIESRTLVENLDYPEQLNHENFECHVIELPNVKKSQFVKRYLNGFKFARKAYKIYKKLDVDLFFIQSSPTILYSVLNAAKLKKPIIYNIHDVFPGSAYAIGVLKWKILDSIFRFLQKFAYKRSNKIIVMSEDMKNILLKEKVSADKIEVVNSWFDLDTVKYIPNEQNNFIKEHNIDTSKFIVQYAGNIGQVFALEEFATLVNLMNNDLNVEFHVIGSGAKLEQLKEKTKECKNIRFFPWQPQNRMSEVYSYCNIEIIPLHKGVIGNDVPSKIALAMACGKPILNIVEDSNYSKMFKDNNIGYSFKHDELQSIKLLLESISIHREYLLKNSKNLYEFVYNNYNETIQVEKVLNVVGKFKGDCQV